MVRAGLPVRGDGLAARLDERERAEDGDRKRASPAAAADEPFVARNLNAAVSGVDVRFDASTAEAHQHAW